MRKTIIKEYVMEIGGPGDDEEMVDNVVDAMEIAEITMNQGPTDLGLRDEYFQFKEGVWAPVRVTEK